MKAIISKPTNNDVTKGPDGPDLVGCKSHRRITPHEYQKESESEKPLLAANVYSNDVNRILTIEHMVQRAYGY